MTGAGEQHRLDSTLWRWQADPATGAQGPAGTWFFVSVTGAAAEALDATALMHRLEHGRRSGFGSVRLTIRIGATQWQTSAFPMRERGWAIPVSAKVRKAEALGEGDRVAIELAW